MLCRLWYDNAGLQTGTRSDGFHREEEGQRHVRQMRPDKRELGNDLKLFCIGEGGKGDEFGTVL